MVLFYTVNQNSFGVPVNIPSCVVANSNHELYFDGSVISPYVSREARILSKSCGILSSSAAEDWKYISQRAIF